MPSVLVVCAALPYPPLNGGTAAVWNNVLLIARLGFQVDLIYMEDKELAEPDRRDMLRVLRNLFACKCSHPRNALCEKPFSGIGKPYALVRPAIYRIFHSTAFMITCGLKPNLWLPS